MLFDRLLKKTLKWEGGFGNDDADRGGATHFGITIGTLKSLNRDIDQDGEVTERDVRKLNWRTAADIYRQHYYRVPNFSTLPEALQPVMFDMGVNHGPRRATAMLQHVINLSGVCRISEDGDLGKITARAADKAYEEMGHYLINALCDERQAFYQGIVANDASQRKFMKGWTNRTDDFRIDITPVADS